MTVNFLKLLSKVPAHMGDLDKHFQRISHAYSMTERKVFSLFAKSSYEIRHGV